MRRIYFIRHGETKLKCKNNSNTESVNVDLSLKGIQQAINLARILTNIPIEIFYVGDSLEIKKTAKILNKTIEAPIIITNELKKQHFDRLAKEVLGFTLEETNALSKEDPYYFRSTQSESIDDIKCRLNSFSRIIDQSDYRHIGIIAHGEIIKAAIAYYEEYQ